MRRRFLVRPGTSLWLALFLCATSLETYAQTCWPGGAGRRIAGAGYMGTDNYIHFRIRVPCNGNPGVMTAFNAAITAFNDNPAGGLKWDVLDCNSLLEPDFFFSITDDNNFTGGCARYRDDYGFISVDASDFASWASFEPYAATMVIGHELMHALGLDDEGPGAYSIMNNPSIPGCYDGAMMQYNTGQPTTPTSADRIKVGECAREFKQGNPIRQEPGNEQGNYEYYPPCWELWLVYTIWYCTTSVCWPQEPSEWTYLGYYCGLGECGPW